MLDDTLLSIGPEIADAAAVAILMHGRGRSALEMRAGLHVRPAAR
jgi:hypothetical protein